ncbi:DegV family protein [Senegalia massiliensis]|uniref:DegV family protein n=1 Tax=Senegalia massiliensis TaxID=1720316 RepID=A0A845QWM3_9CLOT|nr:DegV family protein [Senegalia massiliensis]NBI05916.1 DegV family protein [Senegalia massiliensis]
MTVKIIADSGCDLPKEIIKELDIEILPLSVIIDDKEYGDGVDMNPKGLYKLMKDGKAPKTAQVSPGTFKNTFIKYAKQNREIIYIGFSSQLSGTFNTGYLMKEEVLEEYPESKIEVYDTLAASLGCGLIVHRAASLAKEGKTINEILEQIDFYSNHMEHVFTVDNLEYLYRGGRVSKTQAFVGGLLSIKPILNVEEGKLIPIEKVRGSSKVMKRMIEIMDKRGVDLKDQTVAISHGDDLEKANELKNMMKEKFGIKEFVINMIGCSIGAHSGPGTLAIFFLNKTK